MGLYTLAVKALRREQDANTLMVGYSCVVFAWMAFLAASAGECLSGGVRVHLEARCMDALILCLRAYELKSALSVVGQVQHRRTASLALLPSLQI